MEVKVTIKIEVPHWASENNFKKSVVFDFFKDDLGQYLTESDIVRIEPA